MKASAPSFRQLPDSPVVVVACPTLTKQIMGYLKPDVTVAHYDPLKLWLNRSCLPSVITYVTKTIILEGDKEWTSCPFFWQHLRRAQPITPIVVCVVEMPDLATEDHLRYQHGIVFFPIKKYTLAEAKGKFSIALEQARFLSIP